MDDEPGERDVDRDAGWVSMPDWLGYERKAEVPLVRAVPGSWLSFEAARAVVRQLKLKSHKEWYEWSKSGQRPANIPSSPDQVYRDAGWVSWPDWLGYERVEEAAD